MTYAQSASKEKVNLYIGAVKSFAAYEGVLYNAQKLIEMSYSSELSKETAIFKIK